MEAIPLGFAVQGTRMYRRCKADREMVRDALRNNLISGPRYVHEVASGLVDYAYARDEQKPIPEELLRLCYDPVELCDRTVRNVSEDCVRAVGVPEARDAWVMVFQRRGCGPNGGNGRLLVESNARGERQYMNVKWPLYMVAIRGTIVKNMADLYSDCHIVVETICDKLRLYKSVMHLLSAISQSYGSENVWVAGHSLGAMLALIATRRLANPCLKDIRSGVTQCVLTVHLFNPPNVSLDLLAKKCAIGAVNGLGAAAELVPIVGTLLNRGIRYTGAYAVRKAEVVLRRGSEALFSSKFAAAEGRFEVLRERNYRPHVYVNPKDFISNEYISHWSSEESGPPAVSSAVPFMQLLNAESCHLIPLSYLHINHWGTGILEAHRLHQWYIYPLVNMTSEKVG